MNNPHKNARLTGYSREQIVARIAGGQTAAEMAEAFGVSVRTVRKWMARFRACGRAALVTGASAPARRPHRLSEAVIQLILWLRRRFRLTAARIAAHLGLARSTVARWLARHGLGRLERLDPPEPVRRYQRERPGELIHLDVKTLGRFEKPGHRVTGMRRVAGTGARAGTSSMSPWMTPPGWRTSKSCPTSARPTPPPFCSVRCAGSAAMAFASSA